MITVPIYLCDVLFLKYKNTASKTITKETLIKSVVLKGFTAKEISEKNEKRIMNHYKKIDKAKADEIVEIKKIVFKKQLGYGIQE